MPADQFVGRNFFYARGGMTAICMSEFTNRVYADWHRLAILLPFTGEWVFQINYSGANLQDMRLERVYTNKHQRAMLALLAKECWQHFSPLSEWIGEEHFQTGPASAIIGKFGPVKKEPLLEIFRNVAWLMQPRDPEAGLCGNEVAVDMDMTIDPAEIDG